LPSITRVLVPGAREEEAVENIRDTIREYLAAIAGSAASHLA